jgi:DNA-directed RNA polymerase specialized sigma24 family protein
MDSGDDESAIGRAFHERLLMEDADVSIEIYLRYREKLHNYVRASARGHGERDPDDDLIYDAVHEALTNYLVRPSTYKPEKRLLFGYLKMSAWNDYVNIVQKRDRQPQIVVGIDEEYWNNVADEGTGSPEEQTEDDADGSITQKLKAQCVKSDEDQIVFELLRDNVRDSKTCLLALGWPPGPESTERLRNAKERIMKCLRRAYSRVKGEER